MIERQLLIIKPAQASDIPAIASLETAYYANEGYPTDFLYQALAQWPQGLWVAKTEHTVVGYTLVAPAQQTGDYWLMAALVGKQGRGQGVGRQLCQHAIQGCRNANGKALWLSVAPDNEVAINLYRKLGFIQQGLREDFLGPTQHRLMMRLALA